MARIGIPPSVPPGPPGVTAGVAPTGLAPDSVAATDLNAGAAVAQFCGTDNGPSEAARPRLAVTAGLPIPGVPRMPVPEPKPLPSVDPKDWNWLPKKLAVGPTDRMSELALAKAEMPEVDIDADEPVPDARLVPDMSAVVGDVRVVNDESGDIADADDDIDEAVEAALSGVDMAVVSGDTV